MLKKHAPERICAHLASPSDDYGCGYDYTVQFTGKGHERYWLCPSCAGEFPRLVDGLVRATEEMLVLCEAKGIWEGIQGTPEVRYRSTSLQFTTQPWRLALSDNEPWLDLHPHPSRAGVWYFLMASGAMAMAESRSPIIRVLHQPPDLGFAADAETSFCVSPCGRFAAIFEASGPNACVLEIQSGRVTMRVSRGDYHPENSCFPIVFFIHDGRTLLVAATDWNRLDVFDPNDGRILTNRAPTTYSNGEVRPSHYLDYFHAQLLVAPDGDWIVDNGWCWHPWGTVRSWNLRDWLERNPWESEDGKSLRTPVDRAYYWDGPICWVDARTVAIWGWGKDDEYLIPSVSTFDIRSGIELDWFAGPRVRPARAWPPKKIRQSLYYDKYFFSVNDEEGTAIWDPSSGECLARDSKIAPFCYHPISKEFVSIKGGKLLLSRVDNAE